MDHMGYKNYRDINNFLDKLVSNKHVNEERDGKISWFRSTGQGNVWVNERNIAVEIGGDSH